MAIDKLNNELQNHPDIILLNQQIREDEHIRNKRVDQQDTGRCIS